MDESFAKLLVAALAVAQGAALVARMVGERTAGFACWVALLCPSIIVAFCLSRMTGNIQSGNVSGLEAAFLLFNVASAAASVFLLRTNGGPAALFWTVWVANSASCAFMVYLAFFFRLF